MLSGSSDIINRDSNYLNANILDTIYVDYDRELIISRT